MRTITQNLSVGFQNVRWHDTVAQVRSVYPDAFEADGDLIVPRFTTFDSEVSMCARLIFAGGQLDSIELYPSIERDVNDWTDRKRAIVHRYEALAECNRKASVEIEEDWSDVQVRIRRQPMRG